MMAMVDSFMCCYISSSKKIAALIRPAGTLLLFQQPMYLHQLSRIVACNVLGGSRLSGLPTFQEFFLT